MSPARAVGSTSVVGAAGHGHDNWPSQLRATSPHAGRKRIVGVRHYNSDAIATTLDFLVRAHGRYPFRSIISHHFTLDAIDAAFTACEWAGRQAECGVVRGVIVP